MSKYVAYVGIMDLESDEDLERVTATVTGHTVDEALGLLDPLLNQAWIDLKRSVYTRHDVDSPRIQNIETK